LTKQRPKIHYADIKDASTNIENLAG
jgi:hypothetical protein